MNKATFFESIMAMAWPEESGVARSIVVVIFGSFLWALLQTARNTARIKNEQAALASAAAKLKKWRELALKDSEEADGPAPFPRLSLEELEQKLPEMERVAGKNSYVTKLFVAIHTLRVHRMKVNVASLQQLVERDESTRPGTAAAGHVANFAVMLGILGTFWGLGQMLSSIGDALPAQGVTPTLESWASSVEQVRQVLSGMRTAFSTSLVGMFCAIGAGLASAHLSSAQERLLQALEEFTVKELLPATVPSLEDDSVLEQVSGQLESAFSHIDDIAKQNQKSLSELSAVQVVFRTIVEDIRSITHGDASRTDVKGVLDAVVASNTAMHDLVAELPRLTQAVEKASSRPPPSPPAPVYGTPPPVSKPPAPGATPPRPPRSFDPADFAPEPRGRRSSGGIQARYVALVVGGLALIALVAFMGFSGG